MVIITIIKAMAITNLNVIRDLVIMISELFMADENISIGIIAFIIEIMVAGLLLLQLQ
jgi:hypothetical protein